MGIIVGFSLRKWKAEALLYMGLVTDTNVNNHENIHGFKKGNEMQMALYAANK